MSGEHTGNRSGGMVSPQYQALQHVQQHSRSDGKPSCFKICRTSTEKKVKGRDRSGVRQRGRSETDLSIKYMLICMKTQLPASKEFKASDMLIDGLLSHQGEEDYISKSLIMIQFVLTL